jgi:hypothetical protein
MEKDRGKEHITKENIKYYRYTEEGTACHRIQRQRQASKEKCKVR